MFNNKNNVFLKGRIVSVNAKTEDYLIFSIKTGRRQSKIIPVVIKFNNDQEKQNYKISYPKGSFVAVRGKIVKSDLELKNDYYILINECEITPIQEYYNYFESKITGFNNIRKTQDGYGICFQMPIITNDSLSICGVAYEALKATVLRYKSKASGVVKGSLCMNASEKLCFNVDSFLML